MRCGHVTTTRAAGTPAVDYQHYSAGRTNPSAERHRAQHYATSIATRISSPPHRTLEVGCGSGWTLHQLARLWPSTQFVGIDPSSTLLSVARASLTESARVQLTLASLEDVDAPKMETPFDLIYSINVIEHVADAISFCALQRDLLADCGKIIVICPSGARPAIELLFADHLRTLTRESLSSIAAQSGLQLAESEELQNDFGAFTAHELRLSIPGDLDTIADVDPSRVRELIGKREELYLYWRALDALLNAEVETDPIWLFGASEFALLMRAYCPGTWRRATGLLVDEPTTPELAGKRVLRTTAAPPGSRVVIATRPESQDAVANRLEGLGMRAIRTSTLLHPGRDVSQGDQRRGRT